MLTTLRGALLAAATATALLGAATTAGAAERIVHETPSVPVTVDGVTYAPADIHRFDGRPLYMRASLDGKSLVAYTKLDRFKSYLRKQGLELPPEGAVNAKPKAKASSSGHWARICSGRWGSGSCYTINSGFGVSNLRAIEGCNFWGNCQWYFNNVQWVDHAAGAVSVHFANPHFNAAAGAIAVSGGVDLTGWGWATRIKSVYVDW